MVITRFGYRPAGIPDRRHRPDENGVGKARILSLPLTERPIFLSSIQKLDSTELDQVSQERRKFRDDFGKVGCRLWPVRPGDTQDVEHIPCEAFKVSGRGRQYFLCIQATVSSRESVPPNRRASISRTMLQASTCRMRQIMTNSRMSRRRSRHSYLETKDCGFSRRPANSFCVIPAIFRAEVSRIGNTSYSLVKIDFKPVPSTSLSLPNTKMGFGITQNRLSAQRLRGCHFDYSDGSWRLPPTGRDAAPSLRGSVTKYARLTVPSARTPASARHAAA